MGGARSSLKATVPENPDRAVFVQYAGFQRLHRNEYSVFTLTIGYMRHVWNIEKRFSEISKLDKLLEKKFEREMDLILKPHSNFKNLFRGQDDHFLINRGREVAVYLQLIVDNKTLFSSAEVQEFLEIGPVRSVCTADPTSAGVISACCILFRPASNRILGEKEKRDMYVW